MTVEQSIAAFTRQHPARERKLVAVSGGRDSVALLHALHEAGHRRLVVCHLNHRLRGRASAGDAAFVKRLATKLGLTCESEAVDVKREARDAGLSLETAGRRARQRFLAECARRHRCRLVVLAHHADDQTETVLFNLLRGAAGLRGMAAEQEIRVAGHRAPLRLLRPLLGVSRAGIDEYITRCGLAFREDATNAGPDATRNRLRHEIIPALCDVMQRDVRTALCRAAEISAAEQAWMDDLAAPFAGEDWLDARELGLQPVALQRRAVFLWLQRQSLPGIGFAAVESVRAMLDVQAGPAGVNLPGNHLLRRREGLVRLVRR